MTVGGTYIPYIEWTRGKCRSKGRPQGLVRTALPEGTTLLTY